MVDLGKILSEYFREHGNSENTAMSFEPTELSNEEEFIEEVYIEEEEKDEEKDGEEIPVVEFEVILEQPPIVQLSISEQVTNIALAMEQGLVNYSEHTFPQNWTTSLFTDMQHGNGGSFIGKAYINTDTGKEFMIERDGVEYWL